VYQFDLFFLCISIWFYFENFDTIRLFALILY